MAEWSKTTKAARFMLYTEEGYMESWAKDVRSDATNIFLAAIVVVIYIACTLGSFSPIFCRGVVTLSGTISNILSLFAGFGLLFYSGEQIGSLHGSLPFLIFAVGIEHMYVICEAID